MTTFRATLIRPPEDVPIATHKIIGQSVVIYEFMYTAEIYFTIQGRWDPITMEEFNDIMKFWKFL